MSAFQETFGVPSLQEKFDRKKLVYLSKNLEQFSHLWEKEQGNGAKPTEGVWNPGWILEKYLEKSKGSDVVKVKYFKSKSAPSDCAHKKTGRWFAKDGISLQTMQQI